MGPASLFLSLSLSLSLLSSSFIHPAVARSNPALGDAFNAMHDAAKATLDKAMALPEDIKIAPAQVDQWTKDNDPDYSPRPVLACIDGLKSAISDIEEGQGYIQAGRGQSLSSALSTINSYLEPCIKFNTVLKDDASRIDQLADNCRSLTS